MLPSDPNHPSEELIALETAPESMNAWTQWKQECLQIDCVLSNNQLKQFIDFYQQLVCANQVMNLTRITVLNDFLSRHLLDSLTLSSWIQTKTTVVDIGSGAGFPAIPLAIARPDIEVTAVESIGKKCRFIEQVQQNLALNNLKIIHMRSEQLAKQATYRETFDFAVARAVAALPLLLDICLPLVKPGGRFLAMKGLRYEAEIEASQKGLQRLRGTVNQVVSFDQPETLKNARLVIIDKLN